MLAGCIGIPAGSDILSETVLGKRTTQDGQETAKIIQIYGAKRYYYLMSVDGGGIHRRSFLKFYCEKNGKKIRLSHLPFTPQGYDVLQPVLPVQHSTKWLVVRPTRIDRDNVDLELIVFDENKLYRELAVKRCTRTTTSTSRWLDLFNYGVEVTNENSAVIFHTQNGTYRLDVTNDTFEKK